MSNIGLLEKNRATVSQFDDLQRREKYEISVKSTECGVGEAAQAGKLSIDLPLTHELSSVQVHIPNVRRDNHCRVSRRKARIPIAKIHLGRCTAVEVRKIA